MTGGVALTGLRQVCPILLQVETVAIIFKDDSCCLDK